MACLKRNPGESQPEYRQRMKNIDHNVKHRLNGSLMHNSTPTMNAGAMTYNKYQRIIWGWIGDHLPKRLIYVCWMKIEATRRMVRQPYRKENP